MENIIPEWKICIISNAHKIQFDFVTKVFIIISAKILTIPTSLTSPCIGLASSFPFCQILHRDEICNERISCKFLSFQEIEENSLPW
jgi:hypothetical protein